ncbi:MAG: hypothetical protein ACI9P9_000773, partial [Patescibacteria group bacterium]
DTKIPAEQSWEIYDLMNKKEGVLERNNPFSRSFDHFPIDEARDMLLEVGYVTLRGAKYTLRNEKILDSPSEGARMRNVIRSAYKSVLDYNMDACPLID